MNEFTSIYNINMTINERQSNLRAQLWQQCKLNLLKQFWFHKKLNDIKPNHKIIIFESKTNSLVLGFPR